MRFSPIAILGFRRAFLATEGEKQMLGSPRRLRPARGFTLVAMMIAAIVVGLAVLFLVGGLFAEISDDGRTTYERRERFRVLDFTVGEDAKRATLCHRAFHRRSHA